MPLRNADKYRGWSTRRRRWTLAKIWMMSTFSIIWMVRGPRDENVLSTGVRSPIRPCNVNLPRRIPRPIVLIRWPINRSNRFCDFLRLDRTDRFGKIIKSIFSKFWKREFQFFSDFQNFFGFLKCREKYFFLFITQISRRLPKGMSSVVVNYSLTSSDVERKIFGSKPTILYRISHELDYKLPVF